MVAWIEASLWKIVSGIAAAVAVTLGVLLLIAGDQKAQIQRERDGLYQAIHAEKTGYVARLAVCDGNTAALRSQIDSQNDSIAHLQRDSDRRVAAAESQVAAARRASAAAQDRVNRFLAQAPQGATACERIEDVDRRLLEDLLP